MTIPEASAWVERGRSARQVIDEVNAYRGVATRGGVTGEQAVASAEDILSGYLTIPPYERVSVSWPFTPDDLLQGPPSLQLALASLVVGDILLEAFAFSANLKYLDAARDLTLAVVSYEKTLWLPDGYIWNDHAVAARTLFVTRILNALANQPEVYLEEVRSLLEAVNSSVGLMADERHFTNQTNHGLMQSLAVMHAAVVAPSLPSAANRLEAVIDRTDHQLQYLVSEDGFFTEHCLPR